MDCKYQGICEIKNLLQDSYKDMCKTCQVIPRTYGAKCPAFKYFELKGKLNEQDLREKIRTAWSNKKLVIEDLEHLARSVHIPL